MVYTYTNDVLLRSNTICTIKKIIPGRSLMYTYYVKFLKNLNISNCEEILGKFFKKWAARYYIPFDTYLRVCRTFTKITITKKLYSRAEVLSIPMTFKNNYTGRKCYVCIFVYSIYTSRFKKINNSSYVHITVSKKISNLYWRENVYNNNTECYMYAAKYYYLLNILSFWNL